MDDCDMNAYGTRRDDVPYEDQKQVQ
jgi:hypothetical protein